MTLTSAMANAMQYDEKDRPIEAAKSYERAILEPHAKSNSFQNLMALYFVCLDPGYAAFHHLPHEFTDNIYERIVSLPDEARKKIDDTREIDFWLQYANYIILGENPDEDKWRAYIESGDTLVPLVYFIRDIRNGKYKNEFQKLTEMCLEENTERTRYIKSMLRV